MAGLLEFEVADVDQAARVGQSYVYLDQMAFGERHPRRGTRSVYALASIHGRYPDQ
jgi:hypothetical protein